MGGNGMWNVASFDYKLFASLTSLAGYGNGTRRDVLDEDAMARFAHWCAHVLLRCADIDCMQTIMHPLDKMSFYGDANWMKDVLQTFSTALGDLLLSM